MNIKEELDTLNYLLRKKQLKYNEFNEIIGNYFVVDYEELEDNYYLIKIVSKSNHSSIEGNDYYTDYVQLIN